MFQEEHKSSESGDQKTPIDSNLLALTTVEEMPLKEKLELYYQQWRWKQINQFGADPEKSTQKIDATNCSTCWSDGVSYGSQPIFYPGGKENARLS